MKTAPWLMAAALLFWGWENGLLLWGGLLAAALEASRWTRTRWEFSNADLNRISDLCGALFLGAALLMYSTQERLLFVFKLAQWLPVCLFPLMMAQTYGNREKMPLSVFWWLLRRSPNSPTARKAYNLSFFYFGICVLAASASTSADKYFYAGICILVAAALTSARPQRVSRLVWFSLLIFATAAGQFSHRQLQKMQNAMEGVLGIWLSNMLHPQQTPGECRTRIGWSGQIPLSGKIVIRLKPETGSFAPALLRESTWDAYRKETWLASNNDFSPARVAADDSVRLSKLNPLSSEVEIARYYENGEGILDLPHGTFTINDVQQCPVKTNRLGVAQFDSGPGLLVTKASFGPGPSFDSPPGARDLGVPEEEEPALDDILAELNLDRMTDRQKIRAIEHYFSTNFSYTLYQPRHRERTNQTYLAYFLTRSRAGHCEYFATATTLLLREAGIPARYVTGYLVPESARRGDTYFIRERHAHAWALAYLKDSHVWEQIDTTPGSSTSEAAKSSWWEPASDQMSDLYFQFSKWRWSKTSYARYSTWLILPMILYLLVRIILAQRRKPPPNKTDGTRSSWPGMDSELFEINRSLASAQLSRFANEPLLAWQERLEAALPAPESTRLRRIFDLHRTLRFDPMGLESGDRALLRDEAQTWLTEFNARLAREKEAATAVPQPAS